MRGERGAVEQEKKNINRLCGKNEGKLLLHVMLLREIRCFSSPRWNTFGTDQTSDPMWCLWFPHVYRSRLNWTRNLTRLQQMVGKQRQSSILQLQFFTDFLFYLENLATLCFLRGQLIKGEAEHSDLTQKFLSAMLTRKKRSHWNAECLSSLRVFEYIYFKR